MVLKVIEVTKRLVEESISRGFEMLGENSSRERFEFEN